MHAYSITVSSKWPLLPIYYFENLPSLYTSLLLTLPPSFLPSLSLSPLTVGEYLQLMQAGTDLQKVRKSKTYPRIYKLDPDLLSISWNSRHKRGNRARSRFTTAGARYRDLMWQCIRRIEFRIVRTKGNTISILMAVINRTLLCETSSIVAMWILGSCLFMYVVS